MRLAKSTRTLLLLALPAVLATCAWAQDHPNIQPNAVREHLLKNASIGSQPGANPQTSAPAPANDSAPTAKSKIPAKAPANAKGGAKPALGDSAAPTAENPDAQKAAVRRDPFDTLLTKARPGNAPPENLPPGKAGLMVETLRINGIVHSPNGMIAVVSNSMNRVYFLREGDKLYDGSVGKIAIDGISFVEAGKDAFGKPLERTVTKQLYPSSGEKQ
jgi:hypothetical protein